MSTFSTRVSRREFLERGTAGLTAVAALSGGLTRLDAAPFGWPIGLQLWTVKDDLAKDFEGTLKRVASVGYTQVEMAGFYERTAPELRKLLSSLGLTATSAHYPVDDLKTGLDAKIAYAKQLGLSYMVCPFPAVADPSRFKEATPEASSRAFWNGLTLDDWKYNADVFNKAAAAITKAGMQFAYHNHNMEFQTKNGVVVFDELLRITDPATVKIELDCGWVATAGQDPAAFLKKHTGRCVLLHVKDIKKGSKPTTDQVPLSTEVGAGAIDWPQVFAAAKGVGVKGYFVEQEAPYTSPALDAIKTSHDYLKKLTV